MPRRKSWRLCYDGVEVVCILRGRPREGMRAEILVRCFKGARGWGGEAGRWLAEGVHVGRAELSFQEVQTPQAPQTGCIKISGHTGQPL